MAVEIDEQWLKEVGVTTDGDETEEMIDAAMDELEIRVGYEIVNQLTDEEVAEFETLTDEDARVAWMDKTLPTYPEIVEDKAALLKSELTASKDATALLRKWAKNH